MPLPNARLITLPNAPRPPTSAHRPHSASRVADHGRLKLVCDHRPRGHVVCRPVRNGGPCRDWYRFICRLSVRISFFRLPDRSPGHRIEAQGRRSTRLARHSAECRAHTNCIGRTYPRASALRLHRIHLRTDEQRRRSHHSRGRLSAVDLVVQPAIWHDIGFQRVLERHRPANVLYEGRAGIDVGQRTTQLSV